MCIVSKHFLVNSGNWFGDQGNNRQKTVEFCKWSQSKVKVRQIVRPLVAITQCESKTKILLGCGYYTPRRLHFIIHKILRVRKYLPNNSRTPPTASFISTMYWAWMNRNEMLTIPLDANDYFYKVLPYAELKSATFQLLSNRDSFIK